MKVKRPCFVLFFYRKCPITRHLYFAESDMMYSSFSATNNNCKIPSVLGKESLIIIFCFFMVDGATEDYIMCVCVYVCDLLPRPATVYSRWWLQLNTRLQSISWSGRSAHPKLYFHLRANQCFQLWYSLLLKIKTIDN